MCQLVNPCKKVWWSALKFLLSNQLLCLSLTYYVPGYVHDSPKTDRHLPMLLLQLFTFGECGSTSISSRAYENLARISVTKASQPLIKQKHPLYRNTVLPDKENHAYMDIWTPEIGQALLVKRKPTNPKDKNTVAIYEEDSIVGDVLFTLPLSIFGKRCQQGLY